MNRPRLLDLFSGAGGAAVGYHRAGFDVTGVDNRPQPRYPFEFVQADALEYVAAHGSEFDAIHASPPCHDHSALVARSGKDGTGWMLDATIAALFDVGRPWVVENVETAIMPTDVYRVRLCGSSFGLDVRRHRWFATNIAMLSPPCNHGWQKPRFRSLDSRRPVGSMASVVGVHGHLNYAGELDVRRRAMGINWMTGDELSQAIPPAYTQFIGGQLAAHLDHHATSQEVAR